MSKIERKNITHTTGDIECRDCVLDEVLSIRNDDGKRIKLNNSELVRLGYESTLYLIKTNPDLIKKMIKEKIKTRL